MHIILYITQFYINYSEKIQRKNLHLRAILITIFGVLLMSIETLFMKITSIDALTFAFYIGIFMFLSLNIILLTTLKKKTIFIYKVNIQPILICGALSGISIVFLLMPLKQQQLQILFSY